jgi:hypothetical protein
VTTPFRLSWATPASYVYVPVATALAVYEPSLAPLLAAPLPVAVPTVTRAFSGLGWRNRSVDQPREGRVGRFFQRLTRAGAATELAAMGTFHLAFRGLELVTGVPKDSLIDRYDLRQEAGEAPARPPIVIPRRARRRGLE